MLDLLEVYVDMIKLAYETGVDVLFEDDDGQETEKDDASVEKEAPNNAEENFEGLCDKWQNKYQPPPIETTPEIEMDQSISTSDIIVKPKILKLSEVVADYFAEKKMTNIGPKTIMEKELTLAQ